MRNEVKKHLTQMSRAEKKFIWKKLKKKRARVSQSNIKIGYHANEMIINRPRFNVDLPIIIETVKNSKFYEYKIIREGDKIVDERVLLRSNKSYDGSNVVIVYSLMWNKVITVWCNNVDDKHKTLDLSSYNKDMQIVGVVK